MTRPAPLCLALALGLAAPLAAAQSPPRRVVGFGSSLGVFTERNSFGTARTGPLLPTISVHASITPRVELELWVPLVNTLVAPVPTWVWMDLTARWYPLRDAGGLFVQGGLGFMYVELANEAPFGVLRVPARVGWEFTTARRGFGFQIGARPWLDVVIPGSDLAVGTRVGVTFEVGFNWHVLRSGG